MRNNPSNNQNVNRLMELMLDGGTGSGKHSYQDTPIPNRSEERMEYGQRSVSAWKPENPPVHRALPIGYRMEESLEDAPERIRECRQLARTPEGYHMPKEELFFRQGLLMADYEDNAPYFGDFSWYFPTYQAMNTAQLRGYFTWRTALRDGQVERTQVSYAYVYIYELLHQIGVKTAEEGFEQLFLFWQYYRDFEPQLDRYLPGWLCDYIVYYGLDRTYFDRITEVSFDKHLAVFLSRKEHTEKEYFDAVKALSAYNFEKSRFYREYPEDVCAVTCAVLSDLTEYYAKHGKKTFPEKLFGSRTRVAYQMFASAVFYDTRKYRDYEYVVDELCVYSCKDGRWSCDAYHDRRAKNRDLGFILRAIDCRMRERYSYGSLLKPDGMTRLVMGFIEREIDKYLAEKEKNARPVIEIDVAKLSGIRRQAAITQEKLLVEEAGEELWRAFDAAEEAVMTGKKAARVEKEPEETGKRKEENIQQRDAISQKKDFPCGLTQQEYGLLQRMLERQPYQDYLRERKLMLSITVESINEKLYERFGDMIVLFDGDAPEIIGDYEEELREMIADES